MTANSAALMEDWSRINETDCAIIVEEREVPLGQVDTDALLATAPFNHRASGTIGQVMETLGGLPAVLRQDVAELAGRFMKLMQTDEIRVRVEGIVGNACKKVHADYTDLRLITTYAGPGTDYAPHGDAECCLERVPTGAVALFKGRRFAPDHLPCFHRSPPIEGTDQKRLVLVIDTPARDTGALSELNKPNREV